MVFISLLRLKNGYKFNLYLQPLKKKLTNSNTDNYCFSIVTIGFDSISGTPINRLPIMAKQVLDLYELYNLVTARGGLVEVINKKQWQEIIKGLNLPSSITSAAFTLRTQ